MVRTTIQTPSVWEHSHAICSQNFYRSNSTTSNHQMEQPTLRRFLSDPPRLEVKKAQKKSIESWKCYVWDQEQARLNRQIKWLNVSASLDTLVIHHCPNSTFLQDTWGSIITSWWELKDLSLVHKCIGLISWCKPRNEEKSSPWAKVGQWFGHLVFMEREVTWAGPKKYTESWAKADGLAS